MKVCLRLSAALGETSKEDENLKGIKKGAGKSEIHKDEGGKEIGFSDAIDNDSWRVWTSGDRGQKKDSLIVASEQKPWKTPGGKESL